MKEMEEPQTVRPILDEAGFKELKADQRAEKAALIKADEESVKMQYDGFKHLTTLNTGSILLLVAFLERVFSNPQWKFLVAAAFFLFILSMMLSFLLMMRLSTYITYTRSLEMSKPRREQFGKILTFAGAAIASFISGIACLVVFALKNLFA